MGGNLSCKLHVLVRCGWKAGSRKTGRRLSRPVGIVSGTAVLHADTCNMRGYIGVAVLVYACATLMNADARQLTQATAPASVRATTSPTSLDLGYVSGNLTGIAAPPNATAASVAICNLARVNSTSTVQTIATGFAAVLINGTHGNATGMALSMALANTTNSTQQNVAQGYATAILAFYAANYTKVSPPPRA